MNPIIIALISKAEMAKGSRSKGEGDFGKFWQKFLSGRGVEGVF